jgi:hypothetical protein
LAFVVVIVPVSVVVGRQPLAASSSMATPPAANNILRRNSVAGSSALRQFLAWLEQKYGGVPIDPTATVLRQSELTRSALRALVQHEITALHIPQFIPTEYAVQLGRELEMESSQSSTTKVRNWRVSTGRGLESSDVATAGAHAPYNTVRNNNENDKTAYFDGVQTELRQRRQRVVTDPATTKAADQQLRLWPLDLLRLQLDETWTPGCGLAKDEISGRPFGGGLPRIMEGPTRWKQGHVHVDEMGLLRNDRGLLSANIYLQLPPSPADNNDDAPPRETLHIWPTNIRSRWDWYRNAILLSGLMTQDVDAQKRLRKELGQPHSITAAPGDLVLLCVQRPHAAVGFAAGTRISLQCFVQYEGLEKRLLIDC